jgi:hypothetical protein
MDKKTLASLARVTNKLAGLYNSGYDIDITYEDLQQLMVWRDNYRNSVTEGRPRRGRRDYVRRLRSEVL